MPNLVSRQSDPSVARVAAVDLQMLQLHKPRPSQGVRTVESSSSIADIAVSPMVFFQLPMESSLERPVPGLLGSSATSRPPPKTCCSALDADPRFDPTADHNRKP